MKAVLQVIGVAIKPGTNKPVGVKPVVPAVAESKLGSEAAGFTSIFVEVPKTVTVDQLQVIFGVEAKIERRRKNRKFVKVFVPDDDMLDLKDLHLVDLHITVFRSLRSVLP